MQLSTRGRYAARAMVELAINYAKGPLQLKEIARRQEISEKYLEQIMIPLRNNGYVYTQKGSRGGYYLSYSPDKIVLLEILEIVENSLSPVPCVDHPEACERVDSCVLRDVWIRINNLVSSELAAVTLGDLAAEQKRINSSLYENHSYYI